MRAAGAPRSRAYYACLTLKIGLVALMLLPLLRPDLEQYDGKGMNWRILVFPLAALAIPLVWRLGGSREPYPYLADFLLVLLPFADVMWNTLDLFDRFWWWDDLNHFLAGLAGAALIALLAVRSGQKGPAALVTAVGTTMTFAVLWELGEYPMFLRRSTELSNAYTDTLGDLGLALLAAPIGVAVALALSRREADPVAGSMESADLEPAYSEA